MKKNLKKFTAILLCVFILTQLGACGSKEKNQDVTTNQIGTSEEASDDVSGAANAEDGSTDQVPVTMKVGYARDASFEYKGGETVDNNTWTQLYKENGITLDVIYNVDASQGPEKLSQSVMSGTYPDFMSVGGTNYNDWASQGIFADLTEAYDKYASDEVKEYYSSDVGQRALQAATIDGKLFGMPTLTNPYDSMDVLWIRQDWLDNLRLSYPTTAEEFLAVCKAFKENDPDKNGENDTYAIALNGKEVFSTSGNMNGIFEIFGAVPGYFGDVVPFIDKDGKSVYGGSVSEKMKPALTMLSTMYSNGYIAEDFVTAGAEQVDASLAAGKCGMFFGAMYSCNAWKTALETQPDAEFAAIPIPGATADTIGAAYSTSVPGSYYTMSSEFDSYEAFFEVINLGMRYLAQPDKISQEDYEKYNGNDTYTGWTVALAPFGVPLKNLVALDKHQAAIDSGSTDGMNAENIRDYESMMKYIDNIDRRSELTEEELAAFDSGLFFYSVWGSKHCGYMALKEMIDYGKLTYSAFETAQTSAMAENSTALSTLVKEFIIDVTIGNQTVDDYDVFLETFYSLGGDVIEQEANTWYQSAK